VLQKLGESVESLALQMDRNGDSRSLPTVVATLKQMASGQQPVSAEVWAFASALDRHSVVGRHFKQWKVTRDGLEARDGTYFIAADRLHRLRMGTDLYSSPIHMAEKNWVDVPDFLDAYQAAMLRHQPNHYDVDRMARSRLAAEKEWRKCQAFERRLPKKEVYTINELLAAL
jgi:hypothetical protein